MIALQLTFWAAAAATLAFAGTLLAEGLPRHALRCAAAGATCFLAGAWAGQRVELLFWAAMGAAVLTFLISDRKAV